MPDPTYMEQQAENYLWGDLSARNGAANIGIGLALLALIEQVAAIREVLTELVEVTKGR